ERLVAYMANRTDRLRAVLEQERELVVPPASASRRAAGVGFYQGDEVLHTKRPTAPGERFDFGAEVPTDCALLHLGQPLEGSFRSADVDPFRFRQWSYAQLGGGPDARPASELPDFLRRSLVSGAPAERRFHA